MKNNIKIIQLIAFLTFMPICLAVSQSIPTLSTYQNIMLLCTLGAFGMIMAQFWLTRSKRVGLSEVPTATVIRYHKIIGVIAGGFLLLHPVLIVARRFWVAESNPIDNLKLVLQSSALRPAVATWIVLALLVLLSASGIYRKVRFQNWLFLHKALSAAFVLLACWHILSVGRHSNTMMSVFWIVVCAVSTAPIFFSWIPAVPSNFKIWQRSHS